MNRFDADWRYLMQGMMPALIVGGLALCALAGSLWIRADGALLAREWNDRLAELEQQRLELGNRLQARQQFETRFAELEKAGIVGEEQRLWWAQTLRDTATELRLPYLRYTAAPSEAFEAPYLIEGTAAPVFATTMDLDAGLVHEGDLLRLFERLRDKAPGFMSVAGCTLERVNGDAPPKPDGANLASTCQLRWFSIRLASAAVGTELE